MMNIYEIANTIDGEVTGEAISDAFATTDGSLPAFGGSPLDCSNAPAPYVAVCSAPITVTQWDGTQLNQIGGTINAIDLVAGTELRPGFFLLGRGGTTFVVGSARPPIRSRTPEQLNT
jgi:branched-chain amino acid transport system substrate-binding protein